MKKPTVGDALHYFPGGRGQRTQPLAATVAYVHGDTDVNIAYIAENGGHGSATSVLLSDDPPANTPYVNYPKKDKL